MGIGTGAYFGAGFKNPQEETALPYLKVASGTAAAPSLSFTGDPDTGLFSYGADSIGFTYGGSVAAIFGSSIYLNGTIHPSTVTPISLAGGMPDGATSIGVKLFSPVTYSTAGSKLVSVLNNTTEKSYIDKDGIYNGGLKSGSYEFTADAGAMYGFYLPLSTATAGTEESITTMIGTTWLSKAYCENTGTANTTQNCSVRNYVPTVNAPDPSVVSTTISASTILPLTYPTVMVTGNGGAITSTATPFIVTSTAVNGMEITIIGTNDTNTVTIQDKATLANSGLHINSTTIVIGAGDVVKFIFDGVNGWWNLSSIVDNL